MKKRLINAHQKQQQQIKVLVNFTTLKVNSVTQKIQLALPFIKEIQLICVGIPVVC